jgi:hypothetical protein
MTRCSRHDFAVGTNTAPLHWSINDHDASAITHGDLVLSDTTKTYDPHQENHFYPGTNMFVSFFPGFHKASQDVLGQPELS